MPIRVECDLCFEAYQVPDEKKGKKIKCKSCGNILVVGKKAGSSPTMQPMESLPQRRSSSSSKGKAAEPETSEFPLVPVLGGIGALVVVGAVVILVTSMSGGSKPADNPTPEVAGSPQSSPTPASNGTQSATSSTPKSIVWKLTPDKPVPGIAWPETTDTQRVFTGGRSNVILSATPSPFMLTGIGNDGLLNAFVYNIESKSEFGERITSNTKGKFALSPDGKTFAVIPQGKNSTVTVFSAETAKELYTQDVVEGSPYVSHLVYRSPDELVYIGKGTIEGTSQGIIRVLNAQTGKTINSIYDKDFTQPDKCILSPQGRYLIFYGSKFRAFDLTNATFAGEIAIPSSSGVYSCNGLVFNSDGTQLCGLFSGASGLAVLYFDFKNGSILEQVKIPWSSSVMTDSMFYGQPLQFLRDGAYILIEGQLLVEKATQKVVWMLNILPTNDPYRFVNSALRFAAGERVIALNGPSDGFQFYEYPINFDEIIARTQAASSDEPALLKPGSGNVSVVVNIDQTRFAEKEQTRQKILEVIGNQLQVMGLTIADNADLVLTIDYTEAPGHTLQLRSLGLGSTDQNGKTVQITKFVMKYALRLKDQSVFSRDVTLDPSVMSFRGETTEQAAREQGFEQALNELRGIPVPWYADTSSPPKTLPIVETMQTEGY